MSPTPSPSRSAVALALFSVYVIWGSTYLVMRVALESFPPFIMGAIRFLIAGGILYAVLRLRGEARPTLREWGWSAVVGTLLLAIGNGGVAVAEQWVASSLAAVMVASMPLFAALFSGMLGKWPGRREWMGLGIGALGVALLNVDGDLRASLAGALLLILAPMSWALGSVWSRRLPMPKGMMSSAAQMITGGAVLSLAGLFQLDRLQTPTPKATLALVFLIFFGSIVGFTAYQFLLRNVRPALATSYAYVNPVVAVILGVTLGGETLTGFGIAGAVLIVLAVALVIFSGARSKQPAPVTPLPVRGPSGPVDDAPPLRRTGT